MAKINKNLILLKLLLFCLYAAIGCLLPFLTVHMIYIGLSHEEVTWINTVLPLTALVGPPFVGYLADKFGNYRIIIITSIFLAAVFHTSLLFVPERSPTHSPNLQLICDGTGSSLVLNSCLGFCPRVDSEVYGNFRISNCRQECNLARRHCNSLAIPIIKNNTFVPNVEAEFSTDIKGAPNICLTAGNTAKCDNFNYNTYMDVKTGFESSSKSMLHFNQFEECCEYRLNRFTTKSSENVFNMTCNPSYDCHVVCQVHEMTNGSFILQSPVCSQRGDNPKVTFWLYFILRAIADLFPAILISLFDAVVLTMVAQYGGDYGRQKMFGLFAIGVSAPLVGYLMDGRIGASGRYLYAPVFYVFDALLILSAIITLTLPLKVDVQRTSMVKNLTKLIRTSELDLLFLIVIVLGMLYGYLETFLYIHLINHLSASKLLLGLTITVGIVPSLPFLYKSDIIVNYCGHHYLLILAFVGYCVRFAGLSYLTNPLWIIPIEILELFTLNLMQVTTATLAYKLAPKNLVATAQGLVWLSHFDIGRALGTIIGGYLIAIYGTIVVFQIASVFSAICAALYLFFYQLCKYLISNRAKKPIIQKNKENGVIANGNYVPLSVSNQKF